MYTSRALSPGTVSFNKEMVIRNMMRSVFNRREEDFPSLRMYNDYLEEVEEMTYNLVAGVDADSIRAKVAKYKEENSDQIAINHAKQAAEEAARYAPQLVQAAGDGGDKDQQQNSDDEQSGKYAPTRATAALYHTQPQPVDPQPVRAAPGFDENGMALDEAAHKQHQEREYSAGGWDSAFPRHRASQEFLNSLWL